MIKERLKYKLAVLLSSETTKKSRIFPCNRILYKGIDCSKFHITGKSVMVYLYETSIIAN